MWVATFPCFYRSTPSLSLSDINFLLFFQPGISSLVGLTPAGLFLRLQVYKDNNRNDNYYNHYNYNNNNNNNKNDNNNKDNNNNNNNDNKNNNYNDNNNNNNNNHNINNDRDNLLLVSFLD